MSQFEGSLSLLPDRLARLSRQDICQFDTSQLGLEIKFDGPWMKDSTPSLASLLRRHRDRVVSDSTYAVRWGKTRTFNQI